MNNNMVVLSREAPLKANFVISQTHTIWFMTLDRRDSKRSSVVSLSDVDFIFGRKKKGGNIFCLKQKRRGPKEGKKEEDCVLFFS